MPRSEDESRSPSTSESGFTRGELEIIYSALGAAHRLLWKNRVEAHRETGRTPGPVWDDMMEYKMGEIGHLADKVRKVLTDARARDSQVRGDVLVRPLTDHDVRGGAHQREGSNG